MILKRIKKLRNFLKSANVDGLLVTSLPNVRYMSGFSGSDCCLLFTQRNSFFIGDFRYKLQAKNELNGLFDIRMLQDSPALLVKSLVDETNTKSLYFEEKNITFAQYTRIKKLLKGKRFLAAGDIIEAQREIKSPEEISLIRKCAAITKKSLCIIETLVRPGISEICLKERLERILKENGAQRPAFDIIVASGPNAAMPHARTTQRIIRKNEPVIIDIGAEIDGYKSDLTRTFFSGKITQYVEYHKHVAMAQDRAIMQIRPKVKVCDIDRAARDVLKEAKLEEYFGHALGHGVGLEVHEAPCISGKSDKTLKKGMVFTVEPGIYIPHSGGIRIEDMVVVTEKGCEII